MNEMTSVRLRNFKCFKKLELDLGKLTLLSGINGMGKSTVLQSLLLLRQSNDRNLLRNTGLVLNGEIVNLGSGQDILFEGAGPEENIEIGFTLSNGCNANWAFRYNPDGDVLDNIGNPAGDDSYKSPLFSDDFRYLEAERLGPRASFDMSDFEVRRHRRLGTEGRYTAHFLHVFQGENIHHKAMLHPDEKNKKLLFQVEAWLGEVSPGISIEATPQSAMEITNLSYQFVSGGQKTRWFRPVNVGFGITYTLHVIVALLSAKSGALLMIENPEAHLHPRGQSVIGKLIALAAVSGIQVIVETHSDHLLNGIRLSVAEGKIEPDMIKLHFFDRQKDAGIVTDNINTPNIDKNGRIDKWPEGFFDEWDKNLELLIKRGME